MSAILASVDLEGTSTFTGVALDSAGSLTGCSCFASTGTDDSVLCVFDVFAVLSLGFSSGDSSAWLSLLSLGLRDAGAEGDEGVVIVVVRTRAGVVVVLVARN